MGEDNYFFSLFPQLAGLSNGDFASLVANFNYNTALGSVEGNDILSGLLPVANYAVNNWVTPAVNNWQYRHRTMTKAPNGYRMFKLDPSEGLLELSNPTYLVASMNGSPAGASTGTGTGTGASTGTGTGTEVHLTGGTGNNTGVNTIGKDAVGALGGMALGEGLKLVGSKFLGDSKAGTAASTGLSLLGTAVGSQMTTNIMNGAGAFSNMGNLFKGGAGASLGAGIIEAGFDAFDPMKKSGWEQGVDAALGIALNIPVVGLFATAAKLAFDLAGHLGGKKTLSFTADQDLLALTNGSYNGSVDKINEALSLANTKYSLYNLKARKEADAKITEAHRQLDVIDDIIDYNTDRNNIAKSMSGINSNAYAFNLFGGYDPTAIRVGKLGLKLTPSQARLVLTHKKGGSIINPVSDEEIIKLQGGGVALLTAMKLNPKPSWEETLAALLKPEEEEKKEEEPKNNYSSFFVSYTPLKVIKAQEGDKLRSLDELVAYAKEKNPRFILRMSEPYKAILKDGKDATHLLSWNTETGDDGKDYAVVYPQVMEDESGNLKVYDNAYEEAKKRGDVLVMTPAEALFFTADNYKKGWPDFFKPRVYREGGSFNVIPDGALHARKHNMEVEGITKKGVPVIDNYDELQAEVEREELIIRLDVTKRLENLWEQYTESDSEDEKNDLAYEAGRLLVSEITYNTRDNSGIMKKLEENG